MPELSQELLDILVCPETKQPLELLEGEAVQSLNVRISAGEIKNRAGAAVTEIVDQVLVREDRQYAYPVRDGIPVMLIDEAFGFEESGK